MAQADYALLLLLLLMMMMMMMMMGSDVARICSRGKRETSGK